MLAISMPVEPCTACGQQTSRQLRETSNDVVVNYYSCRSCGHIWAVNKQNPSITTNVTPLPHKPPTVPE